MPSLIRRILWTTLVVTLVIAVCISTRDWRAAAAFAGSSAWGMANLVVWSFLCQAILSSAPNRGARLLQLGLVKVAILGTGLLLLRFCSPFTANEILAIIGGITLALTITILKAVGARLTGRDLVTGKPDTQRVSQQQPVEAAGGHA